MHYFPIRLVDGSASGKDPEACVWVLHDSWDYLHLRTLIAI